MTWVAGCKGAEKVKTKTACNCFSGRTRGAACHDSEVTMSELLSVLPCHR